MRSKMHTQHIYAHCMHTDKRKGHKQRVRVPFHPPNIQETRPHLTTGLPATAQLSHPGHRLTLPTGDAQLGPQLQKTILRDALTQPCHLPTMPQTHVCTQNTTPVGGAQWGAQHCRRKNRGQRTGHQSTWVRAQHGQDRNCQPGLHSCTGIVQIHPGEGHSGRGGACIFPLRWGGGRLAVAGTVTFRCCAEDPVGACVRCSLKQHLQHQNRVTRRHQANPRLRARSSPKAVRLCREGPSAPSSGLGS